MNLTTMWQSEKVKFFSKLSFNTIIYGTLIAYALWRILDVHFAPIAYGIFYYLIAIEVPSIIHRIKH